MDEHGILYLIWQGNTGIGRLFTLLLLALGGAAAWTALWHNARYRGMESRALDSVRAALRRAQEKESAEGVEEGDGAKAGDGAEPGAGAEGEAEERRPRTPAIIPLELLRKDAPAESIIGDRLAELARMKQARARVHVDALQQMTVMRENARSGLAFPGYAVDLCTMGGMLGTFVGLCLMLLQMQGVLPGDGALPASGYGDVSASLGGIIASKKTAFVTTLVGLTCAIVVSFLNFLLVRAQSGFFDALERFTVGELLPATAPAVEDETAMEKLSLQLAESLARLGDVAGHQERFAELQKGMQEAFSVSVDSIRTLALHAAARGPEAESGGALAGLVQQMAAANAALVKTAETVALGVRRAEPYREGRPPPRSTGWSGLGAQLVGLAADAVGELRRNPLLAVGGMFGAVVLAVIIW